MVTSYLPAVKLGVQVVAGLGISKIVKDVVSHHVTIVTTADAVKVCVGSFVITSMVVDQSSNHIERAANDVAAWFDNRKNDDEPDLKVAS